MLREAGSAVVTVGTRGSFQGLTALWRGIAEGAAIHLLHHSGVYNAPYASALLRGRQPTLIHLWRREQGLLIAPGNRKQITTVKVTYNTRGSPNANSAPAHAFCSTACSPTPR